ncbi:MAG: hypothetical protein EBR82_15100 [Caulobacteraceae bacterium]|nr:hypothetical protein [Caulobacteraceae bacterium]
MTVSIVYGSPQHPESGITPYRSLVRSVAPVVEPVTLAEAKVQCRVDTGDEDAYITALIATAREYVEGILDISMITTVWEARYDTFPMWEIILPRPPMQNASVTLVYRDEGGASQTITSGAGAFQADFYATPGRIFPIYGSVWPAARGDENSVMVRWSAGYGASGAAVPSILKHLILLLVAHWYESRQPVAAGGQMPIPTTFETLLAASGWGGYR